MNMKNITIGVMTATLGVLVAGLIMSNLRDIGIIDNAHNGFDS